MTAYRKRRKFSGRGKISAKYVLPKEAVIDYKNLSLIQKYVNERGKLIPRRITGVTAKEQRNIAVAVKRARFMGLLTTGAARR
ncbi:MAG: 30S ribosomal protein S18 [Candidatus Omnitrophica bacterium]|nr:30S ribosomal protein S18 [Candidatus Omnitrophota bacterium]